MLLATTLLDLDRAPTILEMRAFFKKHDWSAAKKRYRREITKEEIVSMQKQGLTIGEIAKKLNCGKNTIFRRLHGREYVVSQRVLDWSDEK